ncbi:MAG TPA: cyclic pyranopterin monophosphate synthase MoaC [Steroidobacteraceae bacterium]|jgi:cyclic pyranopterin phosphate synthase|nr:cyclic pyranopterin monophosphate synthase MoaC [Steroidobacteraceae bacterium]
MAVRKSARPAAQRARLTHLDARDRPTMVDVGAKAVTHRIAEAQARVRLPRIVADALEASGHRTRKGPVFDTAILAGVMAAKRTAELIPFCHPLPLEHCEISIAFTPDTGESSRVLQIRCRVEVHHKTGVEMEALTGASVAALTVYDMCKALSHDIRIERVQLLAKRGGKRQIGQLADAGRQAAVERPAA